MKNLITIVAFMCLAKFSFAQTGCDNLIEEATDLYNSGRYDDCINALESGLKACSLSKSKKEKAYILLINSNIEKDSLPSVDRYFKLLLLNNPAFKIKDYDGIDDFKGNFNNYYVLPKLSFGARLYYCFPTIEVDSGYSAMPDVTNPEEYKVDGFINMNFTVDYRINSKLAEFSEIGYLTINYNYESQNSYWELKSEEKLSYVQWDIGTKYYFNPYERFNIYILGGVSNHFLASSKLRLITVEKRPNDVHNNDPLDLKEITKASDLNSKELRNPYVPYLLLGSGFLYKFGRFAYSLDFRVYENLKGINNPKNRLKEPELINKHSYIDNNFSMVRMDLSFSAIYMFNKVKSKKLRQD